MKLSTFIAKRYFFSKSKLNIVNIVSNSALFVLIVAVGSFFIVLSVFSGLKSFGSNYSKAFDPDIKIYSKESKHFNYNNLINELSEIPGIYSFSAGIEEKVLVKNKEHSSFAVMQGVQENYADVFEIEKMVSAGEWLNSSELEKNSVVSAFIAEKLRLGLYNYGSGLTILVPNLKRGNSFFIKPYRSSTNLVVGVFNTNDFEDKKKVFVTLETAQKVLNIDKNQASFMSIKTIDPALRKEVAKKIQNVISSKFSVKTREELNETYYKMLNSEEVVLNLVLALILIVAMFNVVGAIIILITEKQKNILTLFKLGANQKQIRSLFFKNGIYLTFFGSGFGLLIGFIIVFFQQNYSVLYLSGTSIPYPVTIELKNFFLVAFWTITIGTISAYLSLLSLKKIKL